MNVVLSRASSTNSHRAAPGRPRTGRLPTGFALAAMLAAAGSAITLNAQSTPLPSAPAQVRIIHDGALPAEPFNGTTIYVSTSGTDTNPGTQASPVRTIQRGVVLANQANASGQPARVLIGTGVYRETVDLGAQKTDALLLIEGVGPSTVLTGSDDWSTGWTAQGDGSHVRAWPYKWGMKAVPANWSGYWTGDGNGPKRDILRRSEMVYVNGAPLRGVLSLAELTAGSFFVDEAAARIHLRLPSGASLPGATVEVGTHLTPLRINGRRNVTLRRLAIMRNRGAIQDVGVHVTNSQNITMEDVAIRHLAYTALGTGSNRGLFLRRVALNDNGVNAWANYRDVNILLEDSEVSRNNWRGCAVFHCGWDSVFKWAGVRDGITRRTRFVDNQGSGWWLDTDNARVTLENSLIAGSVLRGISLENNQGPVTIKGNRICGNTLGGIGDAQTDRVAIVDNQIFNNRDWNIVHTGTYAGQSMTDWETGKFVTNKSLGWTFTGNTIVGSGTGTGTTNGGWLWWHTDYLAPGTWAAIRNSFAAFNNNTWVHTQRSTPFTLPGGARGYAQFKADIQLANAAFETDSTFSSTAPALSCTMP